METRKIAAEYRMSQWGEIIRTCKNSGQSIKEFCEAYGITRNTYFYWQRKLREAACTELLPTEEPKVNVPYVWMELSQKSLTCEQRTLTVEVGGCCITVEKETDHELLKKVCLTLRTLQ